MSAATYDPPLLAGEVREGQKSYRAGLRIRSASDVENICTCRESREWGKVCAHSLAVGLAYLAPVGHATIDRPNDAPPAPFRASFAGRAGGDTGCAPFHSAAEFSRRVDERRQVMVCVEAEFEGRRVMLDALPR